MRYPFADGHCDYLLSAVYRGYQFADPLPEQHIALPYMQQGNAKLQLFAMWSNLRLEDTPYTQCINMAKAYHDMLKTYDVLQPFGPDFDPESDKIATVLTMEGAEPIGTDLDKLHEFYDLGVRALTLTWNFPNAVGFPGVQPDSPGLTDFGKAAVRELNKLGVAIDVAHLNNAGIDDLLEISTQPIFASHSNARALCDHTRNLYDHHIRAIADMGGVIGVNFCKDFLTTNAQATLDDVVDQLRYLVDVGGIHVACLGSDYDGIFGCPEGLPNPSGFPRIAERLAEAGFTPKEIRQLTYENLSNYMLRFCK